jgi:hypothetical protein
VVEEKHRRQLGMGSDRRGPVSSDAGQWRLAGGSAWPRGPHVRGAGERCCWVGRAGGWVTD